MVLLLHVHMYVLIFMACTAIPMIAFPRVRCIFIYMYMYVFVATYATMHCIRS